MNAADVPVLTPPREITEGTLGDFQQLLAPHLQTGAPGIVLDLGHVEFINSAGLGALVRAGMQLDGRRRRLALARPAKPVERMLRLIGLDAKLPIFRSVEEASAAVARAAPVEGR